MPDEWKISSGRDGREGCYRTKGTALTAVYRLEITHRKFGVLRAVMAIGEKREQNKTNCAEFAMDIQQRDMYGTSEYSKIFQEGAALATNSTVAYFQV